MNELKELQDECRIGAAADELTNAESAELLALLRKARATRRTEADAAIAEMLDHLPLLIRIPARKILFDR